MAKMRLLVFLVCVSSVFVKTFEAMCGGNVLLGIPPAPLGTGTKEFDNQQLIFPNISFTCSGQVVKWRMAVRLNNANPRRTRFPKLQIWRPLGGGVYEKQHSTEIYINSEENNVGVYNFSVDPSLPFQSGDILGVRQPRGVPNGPPSGVDNNGSRAQARHDTAGDSVYYGTGYNENENNYVFNISGTGVTSGTGIPLVTVEIVELCPSSTFIQTTSSPTDSISMGVVTSIITSVMTSKSSVSIGIPRTKTVTIGSTVVSETSVTPTTTSSPSIMTSGMKRMTLDSTSSSQPSSTLTNIPYTTTPVDNDGTPDTRVNQDSGGGFATGAVVGLVLGLMTVLLCAALSVTIFLLLFRKKKRPGEHLKEAPNLELNNPNYGGMATVNFTKTTETIEVHANTYNNQNYVEYEDPDAHDYEVEVQAGETSEEWGIYVPTTFQRSLHKDVHSCTELKPVLRNGEQEEAIFFTQLDAYWVPASDTDGLYEQFSRNCFREIQRDRVEIKVYLGSGQFGTVSKGVWQCPRGERDVAIKLLQAGAAEDSRVKFLREAAIMGQFSHRNVVTLFGVVTLGEPVMIVMELMPDGDLREHLIHMRPTPGELPPNSLPQLLLDFCHQISAGMKYLSEKAFVHRDLAARNILVSGKTCKIADFGMARDLEESSYYVSQGGQIPVKWTAPEALQYKKYSTASDVWSFGCLMYEIWSLGHKPFEGYTNVEAIGLVQTGRRLAPPPGCAREIYKLMMCCWNPEASERPQFSQLLQTLSLSEHDLLNIPEEVSRAHPQASVLGAPLEAGSDVYPDLQNCYISE